jgi:hypothetical protein
MANPLVVWVQLGNLIVERERPLGLKCEEKRLVRRGGEVFYILAYHSGWTFILQ